MNSIWRFYTDQHRAWRWQLLAFDQTVLDSSAAGYEDYERCVTNAEQHGYRFSPAKSTRPVPGTKLKHPRRYAKVPAPQDKAGVAAARTRDEAPESE